MIEVSVITSPDNLVTVEAEWRVIDQSTSPRHPFGSPVWCKLWWEHFARRGWLIRDLMRIFVVRRDGVVIGIAPMMLTLRPAVGPLRMRELQFFGADTNVTEIRGPICHPDDLDSVVAALSAHLQATASEWDWVQWHGLRIGPGQLAQAGPALVLENRRDISNHYLVLPPSWDDFYKSLPRNIKESLRKCYNSLARDGYTYDFRVITAADQIEGAIGTFLALHRQRAGAADTIAHHDVFQDEKARKFLESYAKNQSHDGKMYAFQLSIGQEVVASRLGMLVGDNMYLYYTGYDLRWRKYSIMTTLLAEILKWSFGNGVAVANLSTGTDVSKTRWRPAVVSFSGGYQVASHMRARCLFRLMSEIRRWRDTARVRLALANVAFGSTAMVALRDGIDLVA